MLQTVRKDKTVFQPNEALLKQYYAHHPESQEILVDFGMIPTDPVDQVDWRAQGTRFRTNIANSSRYQFLPVLLDGHWTYCQLYQVQWGSKVFPGPVDLKDLQEVSQWYCYPGQTTQIRERVLEIHILGDGPTLELEWLAESRETFKEYSA